MERQILETVARVDIFLVSAWAALRVIVPVTALLAIALLAAWRGGRHG